MSGVLDWSPPWSKSAGELTPIAPSKGLPASAPVNSCIVRPPGFPGLELAVPHDASAGIEGLVEHTLGDTVAGIEHSLLDLPTPGNLEVDTVFGPSYSRLTKTGLDDATAKGIARWGGAVFFVSNHLADARDRLRWFTDDRRTAERRKAKDAVDKLAMSRLMGRWGGAEPAQGLRRQIYLRDAEPPEPSRDTQGARLAVATLEGRLNYLLLTGGLPSRSAIGLAALLDARGWGEIAALVSCSGSMLSALPRAAEADRRAWLDRLTHDAVHGLVKAWGPKPIGFKVIAPPAP